MTPADQPSPDSSSRTPPPDDDGRGVLPESWPTDLTSLGYAAYFPLVLVAAAGVPVVATALTDLSLLAATRYGLLVAVVAYVGGLAALLR